MKTYLLRLLLILALCCGAHVDAAPPTNQTLTARHLARLLADPVELAELTLFFSQMPKGGDLHHHYSGAIYAEQYLEWVERQGFCIDQTSYRIQTDPELITAQRQLDAATRQCLSAAEIVANDLLYRELLQRWSSKDFANHGALQPPPDRQFFETFGYFGPVSSTHLDEGLQTIKKRAIAENVSYIETMFKMAPAIANDAFDQAVAQARDDDESLSAIFRSQAIALDNDPAFKQKIADHVARTEASSAGIDDERFTMRYQTYVVRLLAPSQVFSSLLAGFKAASASPLIVGVNIVGAENQNVSMRDYSLHMKMFRFLKAQYPQVKLALHAGELALGMVPPEGLKFHIEQALTIAGADRIGHGIDLAHEANALAIIKTMRDQDLPVEINLTSNDFILGVKGQSHPLTLYRKYAVPLVLSTDDAGVSRNTLTNEYVLFASRYQPDYAEVKKLSYNGLRYSFLPANEKKRLLKQLDERFAKFESAIAALNKSVVRP
ncbi:MAG: adenosine deaminase [Proteobacteria bacterium]|nr:adenosine deaminase [Pseudomonadota bacterium]